MHNKKRIRFWFYIGLHFFKAKNKKNSIFLTLFLGITFGLMVLIVILGVMNGFQDIHISRRIEIDSYHIEISKKDFKPFDIDESNRLKNMIYENYKEIEAVVPFTERESILRFKNKFFSVEQIVKLRALDFNEVIKDSRFLKYFKLESNTSILDMDRDSIILGKEVLSDIPIIKNLDVFITPDVSLSSIKNTGVSYRIDDLFYTGSYYYDKNWCFISLDSLERLQGRIEVDKIGIKLKNRKNEAKILVNLKKFLGNEYILQTAEEINYGYFSALRLEKSMIILLFLLIFIMIATNIFGAQKLTILEKKEDIGILKAIGILTNDVEIIFLIESLILGLLGSLSGIIFGIYITYNIGNIFIIIEIIINGILSYISYFLEYLIPDLYFRPVKLYNNDIYYQSLSTVKLYYHEILFISLTIIFMLILASYFPLRSTSKLKPIEVIKN